MRHEERAALCRGDESILVQDCAMERKSGGLAREEELGTWEEWAEVQAARAL